MKVEVIPEQYHMKEVHNLLSSVLNYLNITQRVLDLSVLLSKQQKHIR